MSVKCVCPANQRLEITIKEKAHKPLRTSRISQTMCLACLKILLFLLYNKQTFRILSLRDLRPVHSSLYLDVLRAQRIIGLFTQYTIVHAAKLMVLNYPQINEVGKLVHMAI